MKAFLGTVALGAFLATSFNVPGCDKKEEADSHSSEDNPSRGHHRSEKAAKAAHASRDPHEGPTAEEARERGVALLREIFQDNDKFVTGHKARYFTPFAETQTPRATVLTCADSRFHVSAIDASPDGDLFEVRNIGNQIDNTPGSIEYGIRHLHTPILLIIGHVKCGAIKAAMGDYSELSREIRQEVDTLTLGVHLVQEGEDFDRIWAENVERNVHLQVDRALEEYAEEVTAGTLSIIGAVYDFRDDLHHGRGRLVVINVNGATTQTDIDRTPIMAAARTPPSGTDGEEGGANAEKASKTGKAAAREQSAPAH